MAESDPALPLQPISPLSQSREEGAQPLKERIKDLDESQVELSSRIQGLKQNVPSWRSMVDTQLKLYKDELSVLKCQLETELEQLSSDFKELKTTLQKQQEEVTNSLKNLGLQDIPKASAESENQNIAGASDDAQQATSESNDEVKPTGDSSKAAHSIVTTVTSG